MTLLALTLSLLMSTPTMAQSPYKAEARVETIDFGKVDPSTLKPGTLDFKFKFVPFAQWPNVEQSVLTPFPSYQEPTILQTINGQKVMAKVPLVMYVARVAFIVDRPAAQIPLAKLLQNEHLINGISEYVVNKVISPSEVITYREPHMGFRNPPPPRRWCDDRQRTLCLATSFDFKNIIVDAGYAAISATEKYKAIYGQSELRVDTGAEIENTQALINLTGISSKPTAVMTHTMFWLTHHFQFIKVTGILQPLDQNRTVVTGFAVVGIQEKTWNRHINQDVEIDIPMIGKKKQRINVGIRSFLRGESAFNKIGSGIVRGFPEFSESLAIGLANTISKL